jgi:tRNA (guanine-N7-)-methyltransferase
MQTERYIPRLFGRRIDRPLKPRQQQLLDEKLHAISVSPDVDFTLKSIFPGKNSFALEIGFGGGEHLAAQARQAPETGFIGAEPFVSGVAKLLSKIEAQAIDNIRIHMGDARPLMESLPSASLSRIYLLHPDPWPKARHHKRRIVSGWFLSQAARLLKDGGELRIASDIPDYIRWTLMHARRAAYLEWQAQKRSDWEMRNEEEWPVTRYEEKARREGRETTFLKFRRATR